MMILTKIIKKNTSKWIFLLSLIVSFLGFEGMLRYSRHLASPKPSISKSPAEAIGEQRRITELGVRTSCLQPNQMLLTLKNFLDGVIELLWSSLASMRPLSWVLIREGINAHEGHIALSLDGNTLAHIDTNRKVCINTINSGGVDEVSILNVSDVEIFQMSSDGLHFIVGDPMKDRVIVFSKRDVKSWSPVGSELYAEYLVDEHPDAENDYYDWHNFGSSVSISDDGQRIAIGAFELVQLYEMKDNDWTLLSSMKFPCPNVISPILSGDGKTLLIVADDIFVYDVEHPTIPTQIIEFDDLRDSSVTFSKDGSTIATASENCSNELRVFKKKGTLFEQIGETLELDYNYSEQISLSETGSLLAIARESKTTARKVYIYSVESDSYKLKNVLHDWALGLEEIIDRVTLSGDGGRIALLSKETRTIQLFDST